MSHLLKEYRGKIDLIYIDPPFDSKTDYKKSIEVKGTTVKNDIGIFEEKQYGDIWTNDEYLQFMYQRLILIKELLSERGSMFIHCDWHRNHQLRSICDEIFGPSNIVNEIIWCYTGPGSPNMKQFNRKHDTIFWYSKSRDWHFYEENIRIPYKDPNQKPRNAFLSSEGDDFSDEKIEAMRNRGMIPNDWWEFSVAARKKIDGIERTGYPTEKPQPLLERIINATTKEGDLVFDCFMGSGTTQLVAMKNGRRFIGADINLGAIQTTTKRLSNYLVESNSLIDTKIGFEVYNVNNYDFFRNPVEARELLIEALGIQPFSQRKVFDGELDGRNAKIMPINRIATKADLKELISNLPYSAYDKKKEDNPNSPVDHITLVCMGHEPDLTAAFKQEVSAYNIDVEIVDILTDKKDFEFKREAQAEIKLINKELVIESFYPMNLMQKLSLQKEHIDNYKQLVESIMIDWNYDGQTLRPKVIDIPDKNEYVKGKYTVPVSHGKIKVKITDLLSESLEVEVN